MDIEIWNKGSASSISVDLENRPIIQSLMTAIDNGGVKQLYVYRIEVDSVDKQSHQLNIYPKYQYVGDKFSWKFKSGQKSKDGSLEISDDSVKDFDIDKKDGYDLEVDEKLFKTHLLLYF